MHQTKTILFFPLNSPGHINSSLGIADRLKSEPGIKSVFLILGPMIGNSIVDHGHELITLEEKRVYEDYELSDSDDIESLDEPSYELEMERRGKKKKQFPGVFKWPQVCLRFQKLLALDPLESFVQTLKVFEKLMVEGLAENHDQFEEAIESIKPDLIIVDSYFIPPCVVNNKRIPWVRLYSANPLGIIKSKMPNGLKPLPNFGYKLYNKETRDRMRLEEPKKWESIEKEWASAMERVMEAVKSVGGMMQKLLSDHGCAPLAPGQQAHDSPHINLYMFPKALDYDQDDDIFSYDPRWFRCDSLVRFSHEKNHEAWARKLSKAMEEKDKIIFFSLGTIASGNWRMMKRFINMFEEDTDERRLYVISKGVNGSKYELNDKNMIGDNYLPQTFFLERADLAIIHGGNNSLTECLHFGVPMIVLPVFADQLDNAQRVEDLKFGKRLNVMKCTREELMSAVDELLLDTQMHQRLEHVSREMHAHNSCDKVNCLLSKILEDGHIEQSFIEECRKGEC